jgi:hypothetical protein
MGLPVESTAIPPRASNLLLTGTVEILPVSSWSDSWSDEDLKEFRAASLRRLEAEESEDKD